MSVMPSRRSWLTSMIELSLARAARADQLDVRRDLARGVLGEVAIGQAAEQPHQRLVVGILAQQLGGAPLAAVDDLGALGAQQVGARGAGS